MWADRFYTAGMANRSEATRDVLFSAAKAVFEEMGYARVSHADISFEAGIGRTTFYEHFTSKEDLLVQLVQRDLPELIERVLGRVEDTADSAERLHQLTAQMVEFLGTDNLGLILHTEVPRLSLDAQAAIASSHSSMSTAFVSVYRDGVEHGSFRALPPMLAGRLIEQTIMTGGRVLMATEDPKQHAHEIAEETAMFLVRALVPS